MKGIILRKDKALSDLDEQAAYFQQQSDLLALRFLEAAEITLRSLASRPELGQLHNCDRKELAGIRVWQIQDFENHLIFYRPLENGIEVLRVLHAARDIEAIFNNEP